MKFSTSNHSSSSSVVLFLSLGFQFANTVSAKSGIRGLQIGDVAVTATGVALPPPAVTTTTEPDACVTDCGTGPWSTLCLHLQTSLSTGIDFDTAMGDYDFTAMELEMISNSTSLIDEDDVPPGPPGSMVEPGSPAADGRPSGPSDSKSGPSDSMSGPSLDESPSGPSDSKSGPSLDESPSGPSVSKSGPSDSLSGPSLDESPSGPSVSKSGPSDSMSGPSLDEPPSGPSDEDGPGSPSGPSEEDGPGVPSGPSEEDGPGGPSDPSEEDGPGGPSAAAAAATDLP